MARFRGARKRTINVRAHWRHKPGWRKSQFKRLAPKRPPL